MTRRIVAQLAVPLALRQREATRAVRSGTAPGRSGGTAGCGGRSRPRPSPGSACSQSRRIRRYESARVAGSPRPSATRSKSGLLRGDALLFECLQNLAREALDEERVGRDRRCRGEWKSRDGGAALRSTPRPAAFAARGSGRSGGQDEEFRGSSPALRSITRPRPYSPGSSVERAGRQARLDPGRSRRRCEPRTPEGLSAWASALPRPHPPAEGRSR